MNFIEILSSSIFILGLSLYFIINMQWFNYKLNRVIFHHTRSRWNLIYFILPIVFYIFMNKFSIYISIIFIIFLILWYKKLDKKLVFTKKIKNFFYILGFLILFNTFIFFINGYNLYQVFIPLIISYLSIIYIEYILMEGYKNSASKKLSSIKNLKIIGITASYGKTTIKNFLLHILSIKYKTYSTPRSVNTFKGIIQNINQDLPLDTEIYIVEMGAREIGDILKITKFINPDYAIVGKIGIAHIEYFKTLENIRNTKMEIISSENLKEAWINKSANIKETKNIHTFGEESKEVSSTLEKLSFYLDKDYFESKILGKFQADNLEVVIEVAKTMKIDISSIQKQISTLKQIPHRLEKIEANGKIILDDSFNGNIEGMEEAFRLSSTYNGRKILITAGLVEEDKETNIKIAKLANKIFDVIIITSKINYLIFKENIDIEKFIRLKDKSKMQELLLKHTKKEDLILFANDAPNFI